MIIKTNDWFGCYKPYPKDAVVPESFTHPAKMGWDLCHRIFDRLEELELERGSKCLDPFAGIFTTGLVGGLRGYWVSGMELEPRFYDLANKNILKNKHKLAAWPIVKQGDSTKDLLAAFGGEGFGAVVGSPSYAQTLQGSGAEAAKKRISEGRYKGKRPDVWTSPTNIAGSTFGNDYGQSPGQMANLPEGDFNAVVSSPPYSEIAAGQGGLNTKPAKANQQGGRSADSPSQKAEQNYGSEKGQISKLPEGDFSAVVSSPPFQETVNTKDPKYVQEKKLYGDYGSSEGQLGNESNETYWSACRTIYTNCFLLLKPGGFIALVVKDFVRKKKRVPLCDQTWELLQAVGFEPVERNKAWLVEERSAATFFDENHTVKRERKSFFRRLAEKRGSPKIDYEEVLICRKLV